MVGIIANFFFERLRWSKQVVCPSTNAIRDTQNRPDECNTSIECGKTNLRKIH
jgi:hypothetical protein